MSLCLIAKLQDWRQEDLCLPRRGGCETLNLIHIFMFQSKNLSIWKTSFDFDPLLVLGAGWHRVDTWLPKNVSNGWTGGDSIVGERRKTTLWEWKWNCHHRISADWAGLPGNIDTAITWKDTGATYIFKVISENRDYKWQCWWQWRRWWKLPLDIFAGQPVLEVHQQSEAGEGRKSHLCWTEAECKL